MWLYNMCTFCVHGYIIYMCLYTRQTDRQTGTHTHTHTQNTNTQHKTVAVPLKLTRFTSPSHRLSNDSLTTSGSSSTIPSTKLTPNISCTFFRGLFRGLFRDLLDTYFRGFFRETSAKLPHNFRALRFTAQTEDGYFKPRRFSGPIRKIM